MDETKQRKKTKEILDQSNENEKKEDKKNIGNDYRSKPVKLRYLITRDVRKKKQ